MSIIFLAAYFHSLFNHVAAPESSAGYFWDASRRFASYCLALALFYAGMGRQVLELPSLIFHQLVNAPVALWPAEMWFLLAFFCLAISSYWLFVEIEWGAGLRGVGALFALLLGTARPRARNRPAHARMQPAPNFARTNSAWGGLTRRRSSLFSTVAALLLIVVGWQLLRWVDFPGTLSRALVESPVVGLLPSQRATPTPTPDVSAQTLGVLAGEQVAPPAADTMPVNDAVALNVEKSDVEEGAAQMQHAATPMPTLPSASTPLPTAAWTATPGPDNAPFALIENALGVNARTEPSLDGVVTTILQPGTVAPIIEQSADGEWLHVQLAEGDAWVAAWVVEISQPMALPAVEAAPPVAAVEPTATSTEEPLAQAPSAAPVAQSAEAVAASGPAPNRVQTSYSVSLESPPNGFSSANEFKFRWQASFVPASNQTFEVVVWHDGQDAMSDGVSLGRALPPAPEQSAQMAVNLAQRNLAAGTYRWGVVLIQREPYRRLALLSSDGQIAFTP